MSLPVSWKFSADRFMQACGATSPLYATVERPGKPPVTKTFPLPFVVIGRGDTSDLVLRDAAVGRRHAYVQVIGGRLFCVDLDSRTGTHWAGGPQAAGWLDRSQPVRIGPYVVRFGPGEFPGPAPPGERNPLASRPADDDPLPELAVSL